MSFTFAQLPQEIILHILSFVEGHDLRHVEIVEKYLHLLINTLSFWERRCTAPTLLIMKKAGIVMSSRYHLDIDLISGRGVTATIRISDFDYDAIIGAIMVGLSLSLQRCNVDMNLTMPNGDILDWDRTIGLFEQSKYTYASWSLSDQTIEIVTSHGKTRFFCRPGIDTSRVRASIQTTLDLVKKYSST